MRCDPLIDILKASVNTGYVKVANVAPIFKEDWSAASSYRPISLAPVRGKMLESLTAWNTRGHLKEHSLSHDSQPGFTISMSRLTTLLSFYSKVLEAGDRWK